MSAAADGLDIRTLDASWRRVWGACPPVVVMMCREHRDVSTMFDSWSGSPRYPSSDADDAEIRRRTHVLLNDLLGFSGEATLIAVTCSWSAGPEPTPRDATVASAMPEATHWRSGDLATDPGYHSWQHMHASRTARDEPALDRLIAYATNDMTDGVLLLDGSCAWVLHPNDRGILATSRDPAWVERLAEAHPDWLARPSSPPAR